MKLDINQKFKQAISTHQEGKLEEAENLYRTILKTQPQHLDTINNFGVLLQTLNRPNEAEEYFKKAIKLNPDLAITYSNLALALQDLGRFDEAIKNCKKAIEINPNLVDAYSNLGLTFQKINNNNDAVENYKKAIKLKPNFFEAYNNLGNALKALNRLDESETNYKKAIEINKDFAKAHNNLDIVLSEKKLLSDISYAKNSRNNNKIRDLASGVRLNSDLFISNREVESHLIDSLYNIKLKQLDKTKGRGTKGPLYGNGKTTDFNFFKNNNDVTRSLEEDLTEIMKKAVNSDIYISESFLNIFENGSGSVPHSHINSFDKANGLINQKFSLQYYLSIGDQNCSEPGIFKAQDPEEEILPSNGMVMIIPAHRKHSAVYNGKIDRVMIGVNFYSLF